jgi:hypothetical protein
VPLLGCEREDSVYPVLRVEWQLAFKHASGASAERRRCSVDEALAGCLDHAVVGRLLW